MHAHRGAFKGSTGHALPSQLPPSQDTVQGEGSHLLLSEQSHCFSQKFRTETFNYSKSAKSLQLVNEGPSLLTPFLPPSSPPSCLPPAPQPLGHTLHCRRHQRQAGEVNADVIQSQFGNLFLKYMREEEIKMLATMTSAYLKEKMLKINPVSALFPQHFFNVSVIH